MKKNIIYFILIFFQILYYNCGGKQEKKEEQSQGQKILEDLKNRPKSTLDTLSQSDKENAQEAHNTMDIPDSTNKTKSPLKIQEESKKQEKEIKETPKEKIETKKIEDKKIETPKKISYDKIGTYHKGVATTKTQGKMGLIDAKGYEIVSPKYDFVEDFIEDLARVRTGDKVGFINTKGVEVVPLKYRYVDKFIHGLAKARLIDGETFYINQQGEHICDILDAYHEGISRIKLGKFIGYVDMKGNVIIPTQYTYGTPFHKGVADVKKDEKMFSINTKGACVRDCPK